MIPFLRACTSLVHFISDGKNKGALEFVPTTIETWSILPWSSIIPDDLVPLLESWRALSKRTCLQLYPDDAGELQEEMEEKELGDLCRRSRGGGLNCGLRKRLGRSSEGERRCVGVRVPRLTCCLVQEGIRSGRLIVGLAAARSFRGGQRRTALVNPNHRVRPPQPSLLPSPAPAPLPPRATPPRSRPPTLLSPTPPASPSPPPL